MNNYQMSQQFHSSVSTQENENIRLEKDSHTALLIIAPVLKVCKQEEWKKTSTRGTTTTRVALKHSVLRESFALKRIPCLRPWIQGSRWGYLLVKSSEQDTFTKRGRDLTGKGHEGVSWVIVNILHLDWDGGYMVIYICQNAWTIHLRSMHFTVCKLYLNS